MISYNWEDGLIPVWDLETGFRIGRVEGLDAEVRTAAISPDGTAVAVGQRGGQVLLWDITERRVRWRTRLDEEPEDVTFSDDSDVVLVQPESCSSGRVALLDTVTRRPLPSPEDADLACHPRMDAEGRLTVRNRRTVESWQIRADAPATLLARSAERADPGSGSWNENNLLVAFYDGQGGAQVKNALSGEDLLHAAFPYGERVDGIGRAMGPSFSPDDAWVAMVGEHGSIGTWSLKHHAESATTPSVLGRVRWFSALDTGGIVIVFETTDDGSWQICARESIKGHLQCAAVPHQDYELGPVTLTPAGDSVIFPDGETLYRVGLRDLSLSTIGEKADPVISSFFSPNSDLLIPTRSGTLWRLSHATALLDRTRLLPTGEEANRAAISVDGSTIGLKLGFGPWLGWFDVSTGTDRGDDFGALWSEIRAARPPLFSWFWPNTYPGHERAPYEHAGGDKKTVDWISGLPGQNHYPTPDLSRVLACDGRDCFIARKGGSARKRLRGPVRAFSDVAWSWSHQHLVTFNTFEPTGDLWDADTGKHVASLELDAPLVQADFSPDGRMLALTATDGTLHLASTLNGKELARLYLLPDGDWLVQTPDGRFDAAPGALARHTRWVEEGRVLDVAQIADRLYSPGLLTAVLGGASVVEYAQNAPSAMAPSARLELTGNNRVTLTTTDSGAGVGAFRLSVNGSDAAAFAEVSRTSDGALQASLDLTRAPTFRPARRNTIVGMAWTADGSVASRPQILQTGEDSAPATLPRVHALVVGVADYEGEALDLQFPSADAERVGDALQLAIDRAAARGWVGGGDVRRLTNEPGSTRPTRDALLAALRELEHTSPDDIIVLFLAGHGVSRMSGSGPEYRFVTADAAIAAELDDQIRRVRVSVSVAEIQEALLRAPASRRVLVLDTCSAGTAMGALVASRGLDATRGAALARLERQTGTLVLAGAAPDAASYESSLYGHGLLTYALLDGLRGPALREGVFVDPLALFLHVQDTVPDLAASIGASQQPQIIAPFGGSFDIGELSEADRQRIVLPAPRPRVARALVNTAEPPWLDTRGLGDLIDQALLEESLDPAGRFALVDSSTSVDAWRLRGTYGRDGDAIVLHLVIVSPDGRASDPITLRADTDDMTAFARDVRAAVIGALSSEKKSP